MISRRYNLTVDVIVSVPDDVLSWDVMDAVRAHLRDSDSLTYSVDRVGGITMTSVLDEAEYLSQNSLPINPREEL